jgi:hypothetical protein
MLLMELQIMVRLFTVTGFSTTGNYSITTAPAPAAQITKSYII